MLKTLGYAALVWTLASVNAAAFEENNSENEHQAQKQRPLSPTPADLEQFTLAPADVGENPSDLPLEGGTPLFQISGYAMFVASGTDLATTEMGMARGLGEGNPLASNRSVRLLHHLVGPAAVWWTTSELQKNGKTKLATTLRIALMAAYGYATLHNLRQVGGIP